MRLDGISNARDALAEAIPNQRSREVISLNDDNMIFRVQNQGRGDSYEVELRRLFRGGLESHYVGSRQSTLAHLPFIPYGGEALGLLLGVRVKG